MISFQQRTFEAGPRSAADAPAPTAGITPLLLVIGGHDPSGAGIQADIETAAAFGCHAASLVTCLTVQNTERVGEVIPTAGSVLRRQYELLAQDWRAAAACKIGLLPNRDVLSAVVDIVRQLEPGTPVVVDPVFAAGSGVDFMPDTVRRALLEELWPLATIRTPNLREAALLAALAGARDVERWYATQSGWVLVKGADAATSDVQHALLHDGRRYARYRWPRLPGHYHGTGCTVASAIAAGLALGATVATATADALEYTWRSLGMPLDFGGAQQLPHRLPQPSR